MDIFIDTYCPCAMCESNRRALRWDRPLTEARDVSTSEDIRRLMRERRVADGMRFLRQQPTPMRWAVMQ